MQGVLIRQFDTNHNHDRLHTSTTPPSVQPQSVPRFRVRDINRRPGQFVDGTGLKAYNLQFFVQAVRTAMWTASIWLSSQAVLAPPRLGENQSEALRKSIQGEQSEP